MIIITKLVQVDDVIRTKYMALYLVTLPVGIDQGSFLQRKRSSKETRSWCRRFIGPPLPSGGLHMAQLLFVLAQPFRFSLTFLLPYDYNVFSYISGNFVFFFLLKSDVDNIKTLYESYTIFDNIPNHQMSLFKYSKLL